MTNHSITFTADNSGDSISFVTNSGEMSVTNVSLRKVQEDTVVSNESVKAFLETSTDDGQEIMLRVDTQPFQLMEQFEDYAVPLAIVTKLQRGSMVKCFVALDEENFYELEGTNRKGISIIKVHPSDRNKKDTNTVLAKEIRVSWRDSSKQICRLTQGEIVFLPTAISHTE